MTFLELCQLVARTAGLSGTGPTAVTGQSGDLDRIVDWVQMADLDIQQEHPNWKFMWAEGHFETIVGETEYNPSGNNLVKNGNFESERYWTATECAINNGRAVWAWSELESNADLVDHTNFVAIAASWAIGVGWTQNASLGATFDGPEAVPGSLTGTLESTITATVPYFVYVKYNSNAQTWKAQIAGGTAADLTDDTTNKVLYGWATAGGGAPQIVLTPQLTTDADAVITYVYVWEGITSSLTQDLPLIEEATYDISFTLSGVTDLGNSSGIRVTLGGGASTTDSGAYIAADGTYTRRYETVGTITNRTLSIGTTNLFVGNVDSITVKRVGLPMSTLMPETFTIYDIATGVSDETILRSVPYRHYQRNLNRASPDNGRPSKFAINPKGSVVLYPPPDDEYEISYEGYLAPLQMTADGDIPRYPERFHRLCFHRAMMYYAQYQEAGDQFKVHSMEYERLIQEMRREFLATHHTIELSPLA